MFGCLACRFLCVILLLIHLLAHEAIVQRLGGSVTLCSSLFLGESLQQAVEVYGEQQVGRDSPVADGLQLACLHRGAADESLYVVYGIVGTAGRHAVVLH